MNIQYARESAEYGDIITVAGRVVFVRSFGKLSFIVLQDSEGKMQVGLRGKMDLPNMWDIIKVTGELGKTQKGEDTIWSESFETLAVCEGDTPSKFHGINNPEYIYNNRTAHLIANPENLQTLIYRSRVIQGIREYLWRNGFLEIETPIMSKSPTGATARSFETHHNAENATKHLRIATEVPLKKALISGVDKVFEIGKIFRNEGVDSTHKPEFTSIEIYQAYATIDDMRKIFIDISDIANDLSADPYPVSLINTYEYDDLVALHGEDFDEQLQDLCFVVGQPLHQTPLCKQREDGKANRFEVFGSGFEIANAFQEIHEVEEQRSRLSNQKEGSDDGLLTAMANGMPPAGGIGIGIDRLIMHFGRQKNIRDTIFFP